MRSGWLPYHTNQVPAWLERQRPSMVEAHRNKSSFNTWWLEHGNGDQDYKAAAKAAWSLLKDRASKPSISHIYIRYH